jgi:hypothetical protein
VLPGIEFRTDLGGKQTVCFEVVVGVEVVFDDVGHKFSRAPSGRSRADSYNALFEFTSYFWFVMIEPR